MAFTLLDHTLLFHMARCALVLFMLIPDCSWTQLQLINIPAAASALASISSTITASTASNVLAPNISSCRLPSHLPSSQTPYDCCAPDPAYEPRLFRPSSTSHAADPDLRVRRPAHAADSAYAEKLARAYTLMKALPPDDPRSFYQQANIHCAYCNAVYTQMNSSQAFQVHSSWLFFPFHRWYIYFHERILARLLGGHDGASFALPFWNYDHPDGASIPWLYSNPSCSPQYGDVLSDALRDPIHASPATVALDFNVDTDQRPREIQLRENNNVMYRALIRDAQTPQDFFGWPYRHDDAPMEGFGTGTVESRPHAPIHSWVGNKTATGWKHMGAFYTSGFDPLFYAHHTQIDRFWELWKAMPGHEDIEDEDYKNTEFLFYNEDGELVRVKAGDASNTTLLGYVYEEVETPWIEAYPEQRSSELATLGPDDMKCVMMEVMDSAPCSLIVERDPEVNKESPWLHDHLVLTILYRNSSDTRVDIYLNFPGANASTDTGCKEFVTDISGDHASAPGSSGYEEQVRNSTVRLDIRQRLVDLNLMEEGSIVLTLVPRVPVPDTLLSSVLFVGNISLMNAFIEYALPYQRWDGLDALF